jgi:hypothetical protein
MKKNKFLAIVGLIAISTLVFGFVGCDNTCKIKHPKNLAPIDWENYNDVYTVYWNTVHCCSEIINIQNDTIKISGWKPWSYDFFYLCDDAKYADKNLGYTAATPIIHIICNLPELSEKLDTSDLTKKCYIKGKICLSSETYPKGCTVEPKIEITNIDDIYFE